MLRGGQEHPVPGQHGASLARGRGAPAVRRAAHAPAFAGEAGWAVPVVGDSSQKPVGPIAVHFLISQLSPAFQMVSVEIKK